MSTVTCSGYTLHFFDAGAGQRGSDKFYTGMWFRSPSGIYTVVIHYGRDGTTGQWSVSSHASRAEAQKLLDKKLNEKLRHGYEVLGMGDLDCPDEGPGLMAARFRTNIKNRDADKSRMSGGLLIQEEPDIRDLLDDLTLS